MEIEIFLSDMIILYCNFIILHSSEKNISIFQIFFHNLHLILECILPVLRIIEARNKINIGYMPSMISCG